MLTLLQLIGVSFLINSIAYFIFKRKGYQINHKYWLVKQETIWRDQLDDHYEDLYSDEFETLFEREDNLKSDNKFLEQELRKANRDLKKLHIKFSQYFSLLVKDSRSNDFRTRNPTPEKVISHYNNSLNLIMECVENELDLKPCKESIFIKKIFDTNIVQEIGK